MSASAGSELGAAFEATLAQRGYTADSAQRAAMERLQRLHRELVAFKAARANPIRRLLSRPEVPRGVWLYGGVGRGKSFLMDCFHGAVPVVRKLRVHFHEFMRGVHRELDELKGSPDPLDEVARRIARRYRLVCFDEFHVSDIADAMILERLMRGLFAHGVTFVITSNYPPSALYPDGLHRDRILPAIALLESRLDVLCVDVGVRYVRIVFQRGRGLHDLSGLTVTALWHLQFLPGNLDGVSPFRVEAFDRRDVGPFNGAERSDA